MHTISFCTAIKNRLHHFKKTLVKNLIDNDNYHKLQFVILDYNSNDGLGDWIKETMHDYISKGKIVYYRTTCPQYFNRSHSRNMVMRLAHSEIVCNIDADNFTGIGYARYINDQFCNNPGIYLTSGHPEKDFVGRICCRKADFELVGGYDEKINGYGFEDRDFSNRLSILGRKNFAITDNSFFKSIVHADIERISEERTYALFQSLYIRHISPSKSDIIILFKDGLFSQGTLVDYGTLNSHHYKMAVEPVCYDFEFSLTSESWNIGIWDLSADSLTLTYNNNHEREMYMIGRKNREKLFRGNRKYSHVQNNEIITTILLFFSQFDNRRIMMENLKSMKFKANDLLGAGIVFKNFDDKNEIILT